MNKKRTPAELLQMEQTLRKLDLVQLILSVLADGRDMNISGGRDGTVKFRSEEVTTIST